MYTACLRTRTMTRRSGALCATAKPRGKARSPRGGRAFLFTAATVRADARVATRRRRARAPTDSKLGATPQGIVRVAVALEGGAAGSLTSNASRVRVYKPLGNEALTGKSNLSRSVCSGSA